jgi:hypothetical protein
MKKKVFKNYQLTLPYYKQGDDQGHYLEQNKKKYKSSKKISVQSLLDHALLMQATAKTLKDMAKLAEKGEFIVLDADTHCIWVSVEETIGDKLQSKHILFRSPEEDEEGEGYIDSDFMSCPEGCSCQGKIEEDEDMTKHGDDKQ